jgi:translation initiation factor 1 (eIF-1/SUI1)
MILFISNLKFYYIYIDGEEKLEEEEKKPKKKVKYAKDEGGFINVFRLKRGTNKTICQMTGFEHYTKDIKALASKFGKKFSCGASVA